MTRMKWREKFLALGLGLTFSFLGIHAFCLMGAGAIAATPAIVKAAKDMDMPLPDFIARLCTSRDS